MRRIDKFFKPVDNFIAGLGIVQGPVTEDELNVSKNFWEGVKDFITGIGTLLGLIMSLIILITILAIVIFVIKFLWFNINP